MCSNERINGTIIISIYPDVRALWLRKCDAELVARSCGIKSSATAMHMIAQSDHQRVERCSDWRLAERSKRYCSLSRLLSNASSIQSH